MQTVQRFCQIHAELCPFEKGRWKSKWGQVYSQAAGAPTRSWSCMKLIGYVVNMLMNTFLIPWIRCKGRLAILGGFYLKFSFWELSELSFFIWTMEGFIRGKDIARALFWGTTSMTLQYFWYRLSSCGYISMDHQGCKRPSNGMTIGYVYHCPKRLPSWPGCNCFKAKKPQRVSKGIPPPLLSFSLS